MFGDLPPAPSCNYFVDIDFVDEGSDTDSNFESAVVDTDCIVAVAVAAAEAWMDMVAVAVVFVAVVDTVVEVQV